MSKKVIIFTCTVCAAISALFGLFIYFNFLGTSGLLSVLPVPSESRPYVIIDTKNNNYPQALSALLTDGPYAFLRRGTSRNCLLTITEDAIDCAVLISEEDNDTIEVFAAIKLLPSEMRLLGNGEVPNSWKNILKSPRIESGQEKNSWVLHVEDVESPLYYKAERNRIIIAADSTAYKRLLAIRDGSEKGLGRKKWKEEKEWPGHMEICDGGLLFSKGEQQTPLKLQVSWRRLVANKTTDKTGEAKLSIEGLDKRLSSSIMRDLKAKTWETSNCIIPEPLLMSVGVNIPSLQGTPDDWLFPLGTIGNIGHSMELSDKKISEILSGKTILSLGGQNKILWFTLPGLMVEFTGENALMKELVTAFWSKLFFGAEPAGIKGFEYGGTTNMPFSVIGAGRDNMAILGLIDPESIKHPNKLGFFLEDNEKAIGWMIADLPRIGAALSEMTKMSSLMDNENSGNEEFFDNTNAGESFQPEASFSPFDQGITDSFGKALSRLGKVLIVWETPESGRINWFKAK